MNIARWVNSEPIILGILGIIIAGLITRKLITNIEKGNINSKTSKNVLITVIFIRNYCNIANNRPDFNMRFWNVSSS